MSENTNKGAQLSFQFFRDATGRLRCRCPQLGLTRPVEKAGGTQRYKFGKVMGIPTTEWFTPEEVLRLQTANEGDTLNFTMRQGSTVSLERPSPNDRPRHHYILNSAVITAPGTYEYNLISVEDMKLWLTNNPMAESTIGYQETASALKLLSGIEIPVNRKQVVMQPGDEALVFRLSKRLDDVALKGAVGIDVIVSNSEIGLLRRVS